MIKVENPRGGDRVRNHPPFAGASGVTFRREADTDLSVPFLSRGRGKESVTLDLKHPDGPRVFADLVRGADVVVENFSRGTADRLGIGYEACSAANPRIVYCAISGFGAEGPVGEDRAYDTVIQALSGIMMLSGRGGRSAGQDRDAVRRPDLAAVRADRDPLRVARPRRDRRRAVRRRLDARRGHVARRVGAVRAARAASGSRRGRGTARSG